MDKTMAETEQYQFSDVGGALCLDFANTVSSYTSDSVAVGEHLNSYSDLLEWGSQTGVLSAEERAELEREAERRAAEADKVLERSRSLRQAIYYIFDAVANEQPVSHADLDTFNSYLTESLTHTRLKEGEMGFEWSWEKPRERLDMMLWPIARSAADLLTSERLERVRECRGHDCGWLFVDTSKNHSRRWCDMNDCGNRAKAHRHYKRQKTEGSKQ